MFLTIKKCTHAKLTGFSLASLFNGISTLFRLFNANAKAIILAEHLWYYLTHSWEDKGVHTFPKGICPKVNVIARLEYELVYMLNWIVLNRTDHFPKMDLTLHKLQRLICHKTNQPANQPTNQLTLVIVDLGVMAVKEYSTFHTPPELKLNHRIPFSVLIRIFLGVERAIAHKRGYSQHILSPLISIWSFLCWYYCIRIYFDSNPGIYLISILFLFVLHPLLNLITYLLVFFSF